MDDRRTAEALLVNEESLERLTSPPLEPLIVVKVGERLMAPPESLDRVCLETKRRETEDRTEPMKLSFMALLAERDPVQRRLNRRMTPPSEDEQPEEDRPTDPMVVTAKFSR